MIALILVLLFRKFSIWLENYGDFFKIWEFEEYFKIRLQSQELAWTSSSRQVFNRPVLLKYGNQLHLHLNIFWDKYTKHKMETPEMNLFGDKSSNPGEF